MRWTGAYYTWTNKTIWSRIDRALINIYWYEGFDFTQNHYLTNGLLYYSPMMLHFSSIAKPRSRFQFCEMWTKHPDFNRVVDLVLSPVSSEPLNQLRTAQAHLRSLLSKLNKNHFADLRAQQEKAKKELTNIQIQLQVTPGDGSLIQTEKGLKCKCNDILASSLALVQ